MVILLEVSHLYFSRRSGRAEHGDRKVTELTFHSQMSQS